MICPACKAPSADTPVFCGECGEFLAGVAPGAVVAARYEIVRVLGRGGMGMVFAAYDRRLDERVALKILRPDPAGFEEMAHRFRSEVRLARKVRHDNVCAIHDYGEDGALQFISMELVEGQDLKSVIREKGALPPDEAFETAIQTAEGLQAIHAKGIVHRDLKPSNIMLDAQGAVRLMDFGIARRVTSEGTSVTAVGQVVGTPEYMSPEQARGERVDLRSDIYAFGVVVFEMFTGRVPFQGDTPVATILKHLEGPPPLDGPEAARIPRSLRGVLRRALAKRREERYPRTEELVVALRHARPASVPEARRATTERATQTLAGLALAREARMPPAATARSPRRARGSPAWRVAVPAAVLLLAGVSFVGYGRLRPAAPPAILPARDDPAPTTSTTTSLVPGAPSTGETSATSSAPLAVPPDPGRDEPGPAPTPRKPTPPPRPEPRATPVLDAPPEAGLAPAETAVSNPEPPPGTPPPEMRTGLLRVVVAPWARVSVDGQEVGTTPFDKPLELAAGPHVLRLVHPDYHPLVREVTIEHGETVELRLDLEWEGFKRR